MIGWPFFSTIVGLMLESGRFPEATALASAPIKPKAFGTPGEWKNRPSGCS